MIKTSEKVLLKDHATTLQDQFQPLLERDKLDDLTRMFTLLSRVPETLARLRDIFESHVKEEGIVAVKKAVAATPESNANGGSGAATPAEEEKGTPVGKRKVGLLMMFFSIAFILTYTACNLYSLPPLLLPLQILILKYTCKSC